MATYSITIQLSSATVQALMNGGFSLYGFKATATSGNPAGALPTVWFKDNAFGQNVVISWTDQLAAYVSSQPVQPGVTIQAQSSYPMNLGQQLQVSANGVGTVTNGSIPTAVQILNQSTQQLTCGIAQQVAGTSAAACAMPLYGYQSILFAPAPTVLLSFASQALSVGETVQQMFSLGCAFDLGSNSNATATFDINAGWTATNVPTTNVLPNSPLVPVLIQQTQTLVQALS